MHARLIQTLPTSCACSTSVAECWRTLSTTCMAALRRKLDWLLQATSSGYMSACGWCRPMQMSRLWIRRRTTACVVWMRAITCSKHASVSAWLQLTELQQ